MEPKQYKNLGNAIRSSVFSAKEAPVMLPDETIERLDLSEDDILSMPEEEEEELSQLDEAASFKEVQQQLRDNTKELKKARALVKKLEAQQDKIYLAIDKQIKHQ